MNIIDRDELINQLGISDRFNAAVPAWVLGVIRGLPSAEKVGHWYKDKHEVKVVESGAWYRCSCCKAPALHGIQTIYCPNCGARMGDEDDK